MNIRNEWLDNTVSYGTNSNVSQFYTADETINQVKENFDIRRYHSAEGSNVIVDGVECRALVQYFSNPLNKVKYDRELHVPMNIEINTGSLIVYDNNSWLATSSVDDLKAYKSVGIVKTNNILKLNINNIIHEIPCVVGSTRSSESTGTQENKYLTVPDGKIYIRVPNTTITSNIVRDNIFILSDVDSYKCVDIDRITEVGLLVLEMEWYAEQQVLPTYSLQILNNNTQITESETLSLNVQVTDTTTNTILNPTPSVTYISSDESILTVSSLGLITAISTGNATITCNLSSDITVNNTINLEVVAVPVENLQTVIESDNEIYLNYELTLVGKVLDNGIEDITKGVSWTITNLDASSNTYVTIVSQEADQLVIKAADNSAYKNKVVVVKATYTDDVSVFSEKQVKILSIM